MQFLWLLILSIFSSLFSIQGRQVFQTLYGDLIVTEPVLLKLISDPWMQRLKKIHQYGFDYYTYKRQEYNRFEHSLGVLYLLKKFGADEREQIAGLLHDISHTAFSHVADYIYKEGDGESSYQDDIQEKFLERTSIKNILKNFGYKISDIKEKNNNFFLLEQKLPNLCADRLEYNLFEAYLENLLNKKSINEILHHLHFKDKQWYFDDVAHAKLFGFISLHLTYFRTGSKENLLRNKLGAEIIKHAFRIKLFTDHDFRFGIDDIIWNKIILSGSPIITNLRLQMFDAKEIAKKQNLNLPKAKFRGVDPFVLSEGKYLRLSEIDKQFKLVFDFVKCKLNNDYLPTQNSLNTLSNPASLTDLPVSSDKS